MKRIVVTLALICACHASFADTSGDWTYTVSNNQATITGYTGAGGAVTIPSEVNGISVVRVGMQWPPIFGYQNTSVTSVIIPNSVTSIGDYAFASCTGLITLTIPNSVTSIGEQAFLGCSGLITLTIPNSVTSIGDYAFRNCSGLTGTLTIPNSVTSIGDYAFLSCLNLTSVTILNSETSISSGAFINCTSLPISDDFRYVIKGDTIYLAAYTGSGSVIHIPNTINSLPVKEIGSISSSTITSLIIPENVIKIGDRAFSGCPALVSVQLSEGLRYIGEGAFEYNGISEITLPESLDYIGPRNFVTYTRKSDQHPVWYPYKSMNIPDNLLPFVTSICSYYNIDNNYRTAIPLKLNITYGGSKYLNSTFLSRVASNTDFISALAANDAFVTAVANKIKGTVGTYGLATQSELGALATKSEITTAINEGKSAGIASVTASPNTWSLFTSSQIQNMAIGDLVLTREVNGNFVLNYDIEQSSDLANWTVYSANTQIVKLPADKAFVRIKAKQ
jgi:hypothetical protein